MGKFDRRSRDQKRKAKLKKKAERSRKHESLAYHGRKYQAEEYVTIMHRTETGIYESFVMSDRKLTDDEVEAALESLVIQLRQGSLPPPNEEEPEDLIRWNIRRNWGYLAEIGELPRRDDLVGVLRTILKSLEVWRSKSMHSQGYLRFLEGFMKKTGVSVRKVGEDFEPIEEIEDDPLLELGRDWIDGDEEAEAEFVEEIEALIESGDAERAIEVCQQLIGESTDLGVDIIARLQALALMGHHSLNPSMGADAEQRRLPRP